MRVGVATGLVCATAASLLLAVPASASHHPPNSVPGGVTLTVQRGAAAGSLVFSYVVKQQPCPTPLCYVNYGKPYSIQVYVDAPGGASDGVVGTPDLVNGPPHCVSATRPVVHCDPDKRDTGDPAATLPMTGSFTVTGKWVKGATAEIVALGYSLNTYQEGVSIPPPDCSAEQSAYNKARAAFEASIGDFLEDLGRYSLTQGFELRRSIVHDLARVKLERTRTNVNHLLSEAADREHELLKCQGIEKKGSPASSAQARACTEDEWSGVLMRADRLKLIKMVPPVKRIIAAQKAKQRAKAARLRKQLNHRLAAERKSVVALRKALTACL